LAFSSNQFTELCDDIFALSPKIRFVGIINRMGKLVAGGMRQGVNPLENKADSSKLFLGFALRSEMKKDFDAEFGKTIRLSMYYTAYYTDICNNPLCRLQEY
jgi:hypothetical protein